MTAIDRTAYPRLAVQLSKKEAEAFYAPSPEEIAFVSGQGRGPAARLTQMVLLKTFQHLGYFPTLRDVPDRIIQYLRKALELEPDIQINLQAPTSLYPPHVGIHGKSGHERKIRVLNDLTKFDFPAYLPRIQSEKLV